MSNGVEFKGEFKNFDIFMSTIKEMGWNVVENQKINTHAVDPYRNTTFPWVAKNPKKGYDLGLKYENGEVTVTCDYHDNSLTQLLGKNLAKLKTNYVTNVTKANFAVVSIAEETEDYIILEAKS